VVELPKLEVQTDQVKVVMVYHHQSLDQQLQELVEVLVVTVKMLVAMAVADKVLLMELLEL